MGCFNVTCNLTNHSMYNDEALFIGLVPNKNGKLEQSRSSYTDFRVDFFPLFLPIRGTLNTYGYFDSFEETEYTKYLESRGINIVDLTKCELPENFSVKEIYGTFISAKAFDIVKDRIYDSSGNNIRKFKITEAILHYLGIDISSLKTQGNNLIISQDLIFNKYYGFMDSNKISLSETQVFSRLSFLIPDFYTKIEKIKEKPSFFYEYLYRVESARTAYIRLRENPLKDVLEMSYYIKRSDFLDVLLEN